VQKGGGAGGQTDNSKRKEKSIGGDKSLFKEKNTFNKTYSVFDPNNIWMARVTKAGSYHAGGCQENGEALGYRAEKRNARDQGVRVRYD